MIVTTPWIDINKETPKKSGVYMVTAKVFKVNDPNHLGPYNLEMLFCRWTIGNRFQTLSTHEIIAWNPTQIEPYDPQKVADDENIHVRCYGQDEVWASRGEAIRFYKQAIASSEGSEQDRYLKICMELESGQMECSDEE